MPGGRFKERKYFIYLFVNSISRLHSGNAQHKGFSVCVCIFHPLQPSLSLSILISEVCGKCGEALSRTQPAVRAMDKLFHSNCFCCMSCHRPLQGMQFYDRDGAPQCEDCYMVRRNFKFCM